MDTDILTPATIRADLGTVEIPREVRCYTQVGSTMDIAREYLQTNAGDTPLLALADEQTAGRGRQGRPWVAPPGSALLFSLALRPAWLAPTHAPALIWLTGVALCEGIAATTDLQPHLKWPNDLLIALPQPSNDQLAPAWHKIGGVLLEANSGSDELAWAIIGCGLNINASPPPLLPMHYPATSLRTALGQPIARLPLLRSLLQRLDAWYVALQHGAYDQLFAAWRARLMTLGQDVQVQTTTGTLSGRAEDVDSSGSLHVRDATGILHIITNGDVS